MDFGAFGEQVQLNVVVFGGGAGEHRTDEPRFEIREHLHRGQRRTALSRQSLAVLGAAEQPVILGERVFDLAILRQHRSIGNTETLGGLALGGEEIADAMLRHDPRGFLRERAPQVLGTWRQFLHGVRRSGRCRSAVCREKWDRCPAGLSRITYITFFGGQFVNAEIFEHRIHVGVARAAGASVDLHLDDALGNRRAAFRARRAVLRA